MGRSKTKDKNKVRGSSEKKKTENDRKKKEENDLGHLKYGVDPRGLSEKETKMKEKSGEKS